MIEFDILLNKSKAFDYVVRDNLWMKLIKLGIRGNILNIIKSMYCADKSRVNFGNKLSDAFECSLGVRLFSMFLNDIEDVFMTKGLSGIDVNFFKLILILYADDKVIFAESKYELQRSLDALAGN